MLRDVLRHTSVSATKRHKCQLWKRCVDGVVEVTTKGEVDEGGREAIVHWLIEGVAERENGEEWGE